MRSERIPVGVVHGGEICATLALVGASFFSWTPLAGVGVGLACLIWRPSSGGWFGLALLALALAPLLALLPPLGEPAWAPLLERPSFSLTPQPRVLLSLWPDFLAAVGFLWWVSGRGGAPFRSARGQAVLAFAAGISLLLAAGRWESGDWRGPTAELFGRIFESRNLAAGFAAVAFAGCAVMALREERAAARAGWWGGCLAGLVPLLTLGSRGAMAAGLFGCAAGAALLLTSDRRGPIHLRRVVLGLVLVAALGAGALVAVRMPLAERFAREGVGGAGTRWAIQQDAWGMAWEHAATGVGLGSFEDVFPLFRTASASPVRAGHPESDWLWLVCESGLPTGLLVWGIALTLGLRCWREKDAVGLAALAVVVAHGLLDVPAHSAPVFYLAAALAGVGRAGSASPAARPAGAALIVAALAMPSGPTRPEPFAPARPMVAGDPAAIARWLDYRPLDHAVTELALHHAIGEDNHVRTRILMERVFRLEPFSDAQAARAFGALCRAGNAPLAARAARVMRERAGAGQRPGLLAEILASCPPEVRREILADKATPEVARAFQLASSGDYQSACLLILQSCGPKDAQILASPATPDVVRLALQELRAGNAPRARAILHAAEPRSRHLPEFWFVLGCAEHALGEYPEAWNAFEKFSDFDEGRSHGKPSAH